MEFTQRYEMRGFSAGKGVLSVPTSSLLTFDDHTKQIVRHEVRRQQDCLSCLCIM